MEEIKFKLAENGRGAFLIYEGGERYGEMEVKITENDLTVYHTEVIPKAKGQGYAKKLLDRMVSYARLNKLKVVSLCPYVYLQFKRNSQTYADIRKLT
jgi:predicted GNAT family acetyltransferase